MKTIDRIIFSFILLVMDVFIIGVGALAVQTFEDPVVPLIAMVMSITGGMITVLGVKTVWNEEQDVYQGHDPEDPEQCITEFKRS